MAWASAALFGVVGLGFRLKLQLLRSFLHDFMDILSGRAGLFRGQYTTAHRRTASAGRQRQQQEQQRQQQQEQRQQRAGPRVAYASGMDERHRALLGVRRGCSRAELKAAYHRKAKDHHPDSASATASTAGDEFVRLKEAYDTLLLSTPR